jgi:hypothetical protein
MKQPNLHAGDIVVALQIAITPGVQLSGLAVSTRRSIGEVHNALGRLRLSGLVDPNIRKIDRAPLLQFIRWGIPFAFPAVTGGTTVGVATATLFIGHPGDEPAKCEFVWPAAYGRSRGESLLPLHSRVPEIAAHNAPLRTLLSLVDVARIGGARERTAALAELERLLRGDGPVG